MKKKVLMNRIFAISLSAVMAGGNLLSAPLSMPVLAADGRQTVLEAFQDPDYQAKPMVRWWFPDAWAGEDENDMIEEHIQKLSEAGYGGVEITMLSSGANLTNEDLKDYGWGTENWVKLLKKALKAANKVEGGFTVDITITAHWPTVMNNIDPNDQEASREIIKQVQEITGDDIQNGNITLQLPETKTIDSADALTKAPFIFTDELVDAYLVKSNGSDQGQTTYDFDSAVNVTDAIKATDEGKRAGVPDEKTCEEYGLDYNTVLEVYGEAPAADADLSKSFNGKQDEESRRARMQDTQYTYTLDTSKLGEEAVKGLENGDYMLVGTYCRGTGQIMSDGPFGGASDAMYSRTYVSNYFTEKGTNALLEYWNTNILSDKELVELLKENGSCIFEDSIEAGVKSGGSFWSEQIKDRFAQEYGDTYKDMLALLVTMGGNSFTSEDSAIQEQLGDIKTGYQITLGKLYDEQHSAKISQWAKKFNYKYRAQCYAITGQDVCGSEMATDIPEGDNSSKGDGLRKMASVINVENKESFSMEAVTATGNAKLNWADVVTEVGQNYSDGVNHVVLHGTPYTKSVNGFIADWPGWTAFGNNFAGSYAIWRCDWNDMYNMTGYMARNQAVLQKGTAKVDLAFLNDSSTGASLFSGNAFQHLLDKGYSYNYFTEALMKSDNAVVTNGLLAEHGPAYKALVVNEVSNLSADGMKKILEYVQAGLPVVFYNCTISDVYGPETADNSKEILLFTYKQIQNYDNVAAASTEEELENVLAAMEITSDAKYDAAYLETSHYVDDQTGSDYYYLYHNTQTGISQSGMVDNGKAARAFKTAEDINATITLEGDGVPYELDAWTGDVTPIAEYSVNGDGTVSVDVELAGGESTIVALLEEKDKILHADVADGKISYAEDGSLVYKSNTASSETIHLSDGTQAEVKIANSLSDVDLTEGWTLKVESWGPGEAYSSDANIDHEKTENSSSGNTVYINPSLTEVTTEEFDINTLGKWSDIGATAGQLEHLGVQKMQDVAGIGYYTNTFELPEGWDESTGAVLKLTYSQDMVPSVTVNGTTIHGVDNASDQVDIGAHLKNGKNTITIKLATPMFNRMLANGRQAIGRPGDMNMTGTKPIDNGLLTVVLSPYTEVALEAQDTVESSARNMLLSLCDQLAGMASDTSYTAESRKALSDALDQAKAAAKKEQATNKEITDATAQIVAAASKLERVRKEAADHSLLAAFYDSVKGLTKGNYTDSSWNRLQSAVKDAQALLGSASAKQADINRATVNLITAINGLKENEAAKIQPNKVYTVGNLKYKVTKTTDGNEEVSVSGVKSKKLTRATIGSTVTINGVKCKVTSIAGKAFKGCGRLKKVTVGANVKRIGSYAFYKCSMLKNISLQGTNLKTVGKNALKGISGNAVIKVAKVKYNVYKKILKGKGQSKTVKIKK